MKDNLGFFGPIYSPKPKPKKRRLQKHRQAPIHGARPDNGSDGGLSGGDGDVDEGDDEGASSPNALAGFPNRGAEESRHARPHMFRGGEEGHGASESRHGKEAEARDVNTRKNKEYWRSEMFRLLPGFAARHDTDIEAKKAALQTLVDQSFEQAQPNGGCCSQPMLQPSQRYDASYVSLTCSFKFEVKVKKCASCNMTVIAQPLHCGCFGSTPEHPHVWFDLAVFPAYAKLALGSGVSSTGCCYASRGTIALGGRGTTLRRRDDART